MGKVVFGYVRVSARDQNEARQMIALREYGVKRENLYLDKLSGKDFNRPEYRKLVRKLRKGDTMVIKSIDRLGRSYAEILEQWRVITREKQADIVVLDMPLLDTRRGRDLTGVLISDIVLQLLSYVAQTEREFIHTRQSEGIAAARKRGVRFGAKPKQKPQNYPQVLVRWQSGAISAREAGRQLGICHGTFLKWAKNEPPLQPES